MLVQIQPEGHWVVQQSDRSERGAEHHCAAGHLILYVFVGGLSGGHPLADGGGGEKLREAAAVHDLLPPCGGGAYPKVRAAAASVRQAHVP